jgi:hypothetical protein
MLSSTGLTTNDINLQGTVNVKEIGGSTVFTVNTAGTINSYGGLAYVGAGTFLTTQNNNNAGFAYRFNDQSATSRFTVQDSAFNVLFAVNGDGSVDGLPVSKLSDTNITTPSDGQYLKYNAGTSQWINDTLPAIPSNINDLGDVAITTPVLNEVLTYNGSQWINQAPAGGGSTGDYVFSTNTITLSGQNNPLITATPYQSDVNRNQLDIHSDLIQFGSSIANPNLAINLTSNETLIQNLNASNTNLRILTTSTNGWVRLQSYGGGGGVALEASQHVLQTGGNVRYVITPTTLHNFRSTLSNAAEAYRMETNTGGVPINAVQILGDGTVNIPNLNPSDSRDKVNIQDLDKGLDFINSLRTVSYNLDERKDYYNDKDIYAEDERPANGLKGVVRTGKHKKARKGFGIIAQELLQLDGINDRDFEMIEERSDRYLVNYTQFIAPLIKAVQELSAEVAYLKTKIV